MHHYKWKECILYKWYVLYDYVTLIVIISCGHVLLCSVKKVCRALYSKHWINILCYFLCCWLYVNLARYFMNKNVFYDVCWQTKIFLPYLMQRGNQSEQKGYVSRYKGIWKLDRCKVLLHSVQETSFKKTEKKKLNCIFISYFLFFCGASLFFNWLSKFVHSKYSFQSVFFAHTFAFLHINL